MRAGAVLVALAGAGWLSPTLPAADSHLSPQRLDLLDQRGYFTPTFKSAIHDLVDARRALERAKQEEARSQATLPDLEKQSAEATAEAGVLRKTLALYTHPEVSDLDALREAMKSPSAKPEERLALAQAFVWSYPSDPHEAEAEQDLQRLQQEISGGQQAAIDAEKAREGARVELMKRVKSRNLSLPEWQDFLRDMSQEDLLTYLGRPKTEGDGYWVYAGNWAADPATKRGSGLLITFNGTRVINVEAAP